MHNPVIAFGARRHIRMNLSQQMQQRCYFFSSQLYSQWAAYIEALENNNPGVKDIKDVAMSLIEVWPACPAHS